MKPYNNPLYQEAFDQLIEHLYQEQDFIKAYQFDEIKGMEDHKNTLMTAYKKRAHEILEKEEINSSSWRTVMNDLAQLESILMQTQTIISMDRDVLNSLFSYITKLCEIPKATYSKKITRPTQAFAIQQREY